MIKISLIFLVTLVCLADLGAEETASTLVSGNVMVDVGDRGNVGYFSNADSLIGMKLGAVSYNYQIGKYEVTVEDWYRFLIAVASQCDHNQLVDAHHLWNEEMEPWITRVEFLDGRHFYNLVQGKENFPITYVSMVNAMRYCNWIEQGAPALESGEDMDAITEHGSYEFSPDGSVIEHQDSHVYLPSQNEWIKAAYYAGGGRDVGYWCYPTQNNWYAPTFDNDNPTGSNMANYNGAWNGWSGSFFTRAD